MKLSKYKKSICLFCCIIGLITVIYSIVIVVKVSNQTAKVNALPITNKVIVIDAGHGLPDEGAFLLYKKNKQLTF